ncbi:hypothetical protein F4777DRAFT_525844 [Nemania sp. FL0916]|nr:hypothetical protein F4777DRAFT_525844 [Nemania sp. FL0916]
MGSNSITAEMAAPVSGAVLLEQEVERRWRLHQRGILSTGCAEIDDAMLVGGGFERGCVVGVSAEEMDFAVLLGLQTIARTLVFADGNSTPRRAAIVTTLPVTTILPILRDVIRCQAQLKLGPRHPDVDAELRRSLEAISISRIFDIEGLWEVLRELREAHDDRGSTHDEDRGEKRGEDTVHPHASDKNYEQREQEREAEDAMRNPADDERMETPPAAQREEVETNPTDSLLSSESPEPTAPLPRPITQLPPLRIASDIEPLVRRSEVLDSEDEAPLSLSPLSSSPLSSPPPSSELAAEEASFPVLERLSSPASQDSGSDSGQNLDPDPGPNVEPHSRSQMQSSLEPATFEPGLEPPPPPSSPSLSPPQREEHLPSRPHSPSPPPSAQRKTNTSQRPTIPDIILVTHVSSLFSALFTQRERASAHEHLRDLGTYLRRLTRMGTSTSTGGPLIMLLNTTTSTSTSTSQRPSTAAQQPQPPPPPAVIPTTLRSIFTPNPQSHPQAHPHNAGSISTGINKPAFGASFAQLLDLHLLCTRLPRTRDDAIVAAALGSAAGTEDVRRVWVVEVLLDELRAWDWDHNSVKQGESKNEAKGNGDGNSKTRGVDEDEDEDVSGKHGGSDDDDGSNGIELPPHRINREQRWAAVDVFRGVRIVDAFPPPHSHPPPHPSYPPAAASTSTT